MKKIMSLAMVMIAGITISFAQTSTSITSSTSNDAIQNTSPAVKVVDVNQPAKKCTTTSACCKGGSKASAVTTSTTPDAVITSEKVVSGGECHSVTMGTSAVKPQTATVTDPED